ncbi:MAG: oligosaccharide flippase family protein [Pirellulales bacterium]|nr:oligosaccharide flippase family protein [Pirellulales bacterium]
MSTRVETIPARATPLHRVVGPVTGWRRAASDWLVVGGTTVFCHVLGAATSLLLRILLDPAQMGVWQTVRLLLSYGNYANLGISKGAVRELTIARGRGEEAHARRGLNLAFTVNTLTSAAYAGVLVFIGARIAWGEGTPAGTWPMAWIVAGLLAVLSRYVTFHVTILRGQQSFGATSRLAVVEAVGTLAVGGLCTWIWGLPGLYLGTLIVMLAALAFVWRHRGATLDWAWDWAEIRRLVAIGGPILLATTLFTLFRSIDKLMILAWLSDREYQLGCYSLALMVGAQLYGLGSITSLIMSPRYGEKFGVSADRADVARLAARTGEVQAVVMALVGGLSLVLAGPLLGWLLPRYRPGLVPMVWLIPGAILLTIAAPANQFLIAVNRQRRAVAVAAAVVVLAAAANYFALAAGWGLAGVAMATTASYACYFVLVVGASLWIELPGGERLRWLATVGVALLPTLLVALPFVDVEPAAGVDWISLVYRAGLVVVVWLGCAAVVWRLGDWRRQLAR